MVFGILLEKLNTIKKISLTDTVYAEQARKILEKEATTHNITYIDLIIESYKKNIEDLK